MDFVAPQPGGCQDKDNNLDHIQVSPPRVFLQLDLSMVVGFAGVKPTPNPRSAGCTCDGVNLW